MRIAYIAPYQGPTFFKSRPSINSLGLAANLKIELITELLLRSGHEVEVISPGEVAGPLFKLFPRLPEAVPFHPDVRVEYASALPLRFVNGLWSGLRTLALFKERHRVRPFDLVIIYNLGSAQVRCANYITSHMSLPVVLEYEDDAFVDIGGASSAGFRARYNLGIARKALDHVSGGIAVSPHLSSKIPKDVPKLLLRGVVGDHIAEVSQKTDRKNWVVYSGTYTRNKGLEQLITAWSSLKLPDWELHLAGKGELTELLESMGKPDPSIIFHGLLNRTENAELLGQAKIGINPHNVSHTPGNVFAFKIIEYLAAGLHCITTPMGELEPEIETGLTYMQDNSPATITDTLRDVISNRTYSRLAVDAALNTYGSDAVATALRELLDRTVSRETFVPATN